MANYERITVFLERRIIASARDFLAGLRQVDEVSREQLKGILRLADDLGQKKEEKEKPRAPQA